MSDVFTKPSYIYENTETNSQNLSVRILENQNSESVKGCSLEKLFEGFQKPFFLIQSL